MSKSAEEVSKLTETTYRNVMEHFNPGLRNLVNLGKNYEKSVSAMAMAGRLYFDALSKIGENATSSPVSKELGAVLMEISEVHRRAQYELEENFKRFHREIITELERKTDMDVKYMTATFKRYQMEHKIKQDTLERSQSDLKKLRRKSQGKNANKYENKESECLETLTNRQTDMQLFLAEGCKEALLEEKRRFCFLVDKHCMLTYQFGSFHDKARDILGEKLSSWQEQCKDATNIPESVLAMIEGLRVPVSLTPMPSPSPSRHSVNIHPPAPAQKALTSPLANMFTQDNTNSKTTFANSNADHVNSEDNGLGRSVSVATGLNNMVKRPRVRTIFPHTAGNNSTLISFDEGDVIILLIPDERDGWMYGELEKNGKRGWFPSSYCRALTETPVNNNSETPAPYRSRSVVNLHHQDTETDEATMVLPPADYCDLPQRNSIKSNVSSSSSVITNNHHHPSPAATAAASTPLSSSDHSAGVQSNGTSRAPPAFLAGGNPFATVRLRPTVTNDRSAPAI